VNSERVLLVLGPESDLSKDLVGERAGHDERRVSGSTSEVDCERKERRRKVSERKGKEGGEEEEGGGRNEPSRPSARRMMCRPEAMVYRSTWGLMLECPTALALSHATSISMSK